MFAVRFLIAIGLCCCLSFHDSSCRTLPKAPTPCKKSDPRFNECLLNILKLVVKPDVLHGVPELSIPTLDPIHVSSAIINGTQQQMKMTGEMYNLTAKGFDTTSVKKFKIDVQNKEWDITVDIPLVTFVMDFDLNITLQNMTTPINGKGKCHGKVSHSIIRLLANSEVKDNRLTWNHIEISLHFEDADVHFVNSPTSEIESQFFNTNKRVVLDLLTPIVQKATKQLLIRYSNRIMSTMEVTEIIVD